MRSLFTFFFLLISYLLLAQEPLWIQMEDNYPFHITYSRIGIDQTNNIYAVSDWLHPTNSYERLSRIVKYLPNGNKEWSINYQADTTSTQGVYICENGYTYIVRTFSLINLDRYSVIQVIDNEGNLLFSHKSYDLHYCDVIADNSGNSYITGVSYEPEHDMELILIKFNSNGIKEWQTYWDTQGDNTRGKKILLDEDLNIFVVGNYNNNQFESLVLAKYNPDGVLLNHSLFLIELWYSILVFRFDLDSNKNFYVTGRYEESETWWKRGFIYKFDSNLTEQWHDTITLPFNSFTDFKIDEDKNIILSGFEEHDLNDSPHATYAKYDAYGNKLWHFTNDSIKSRFNSIAIHNNNYFLTGRIRNEEKYSYDYITVRLNSDGEIIDSHILEGADTTYNVGVDNIIDSNGNLICTGIYRDTARYCLTVKYDALTFKEEIIQNTPEFLKVYPNPARSNININLYLENKGIAVIALYNLEGEIVKHNTISNLPPGFNTITLDLNRISSGLYLIKCHLNNMVISQKILISN